MSGRVGASLEADLMLNAAHASVQQQRALLNLGFLTNEVLNLLSEEVLFVDVHILVLAEVALEVHDIFHDLLQGLVVKLDGLVLKGCQLTTQQLALLLILVQFLVELNNVCLSLDHLRSLLTWTFWTRGLMAAYEAAKSCDSATPPLTGDLLLLLNIFYFSIKMFNLYFL